MTRDKKSYIAAAIAAIIIVLISIPSMLFIGSVAYAEESDPIQTASKFVSDGDVITVNYYDTDMDLIATKQITANGSVRGDLFRCDQIHVRIIVVDSNDVAVRYEFARSLYRIRFLCICDGTDK